MEGFYGFEVHAGQPAVQASIPDGCIFRMMQVALPAGATEPITLRVSVEKGKPSFVLVTLDPKLALYQSSLDSVFGSAQGASFSADGAGSLHICGYIQPSMDADDDFFDDEPDDDDGEDDADYGGDIYFGDEEGEEGEELPTPPKRGRVQTESGNRSERAPNTTAKKKKK